MPPDGDLPKKQADLECLRDELKQAKALYDGTKSLGTSKRSTFLRKELMLNYNQAIRALSDLLSGLAGGLEQESDRLKIPARYP